ncbi:cupin domain-containing protein [Parafrankia discariae]|uniref:cupin domain-containing protein n=1 Tax=Parafrankia discariae TaxID=365528 RepID=UPI0003A8214F|nr:cupin domain-containing protein [Parafrankia discariae]
MNEELVVRRVVTGVDTSGNASILSDGVVTEVRVLPNIEGWAIATVWQNEDASRVPLHSMTEGTKEVADQRRLPPGGTRFLIWRLPPDSAGENPAGMHETDTVDCVVVLSGQVTLVLGNGDQLELAPGDCLVQGGNLHHWRNKTSEPCVMAVFMVGAHRP